MKNALLVPGSWWALLRGPRTLPVIFATKRGAQENRDPDEYLVRVWVQPLKRKKRAR